MDKRVKIIVCYYGNLPEWFDLWLLSCGANPEFDFLVVTDQKVNETPNNVEILNISMTQLKEKFSNVLGFECVLDNPYKLCDYKPLYGLALADRLKGYDFWGHCDVDLIFGQLKDFITEDLLERYDVIGRYGHLKLYRNTAEINNLYKKSGSTFKYKTVYKNKENYSFDEMSGMNRIERKHEVRKYNDLPVANAETEVKRMKVLGYEACREFFCWRKGNLIRVYESDDGFSTQTYAYLHFSGKKPHCKIEVDEKPEGFYILSDEITTRKRKDFSFDEINEYNRFINLDVDQEERITSRKQKRENVMKLSLKRKYIWLKIHWGIINERRAIAK